MLKKILALIAYTFTSTSALALETLVDKPHGTPKGLVVIAPAKKYLMKERLFSELAKKLSGQGYIAVRFNWSPETLVVPSLELERAAQNINEVATKAQAQFGFDAEHTILISKSFSTKALGPSQALAKTHILLTPNCSPEAPFQKTYWNILNSTDIAWRIFISEEDPYCDVKEIKQALKSLKKLELLTTTHGDHNFVISTTADDTSTYEYQDQVINTIATMLSYSL